MSKSDGYSVDLELLDNAIGLMQKFGTDVEGWLTEVDQHITELHLSWDSEAAAAQRAAHDRWMAGAAQMHQALEELRDAARRAHTNYSGAIATNRRMWPA